MFWSSTPTWAAKLYGTLKWLRYDSGIELHGQVLCTKWRIISFDICTLNNVIEQHLKGQLPPFPFVFVIFLCLLWIHSNRLQKCFPCCWHPSLKRPENQPAERDKPWRRSKSESNKCKRASWRDSAAVSSLVLRLTHQKERPPANPSKPAASS